MTHLIHHILITATLLLALCTHAANKDDPLTSAELAVQAQTLKWIELWNPGEAPLDKSRFAAYANLFAGGDRYIAFDDFTGDVLVLRGYQAYQDTWIPVMANFSSWHAEPVGEIDIDLSGDTAVVAFKFRGYGTLPSGEVHNGYQYTTLVWRRYEPAGWQLIHEHITGAAR